MNWPSQFSQRGRNSQSSRVLFRKSKGKTERRTNRNKQPKKKQDLKKKKKERKKKKKKEIYAKWLYLWRAFSTRVQPSRTTNIVLNKTRGATECIKWELVLVACTLSKKHESVEEAKSHQKE